ncbi:MAG: ornithine carbamoyltransferase [Candidatus Gastranaerophilales bacterium]|nr:ornithine carbamoyltransferase [Candidatus Gastranaerophilales bacterium]
MNLKGKDFLSLADFNKESLTYLLNLATRLKQDNRMGQTHHVLNNKTLVLIFSKPSLRTRVSFEVGIRQLGGNSIVLKQDEINLGVRETIADTARVLSRYADGVMIRTFDHNDVVEFAKWSDVPVINGLTDSSHPCQILADLLTIKETFGELENLKLAYIGDGNNVANSLLLGCSTMGMDISICCPEGYDPDTVYLNKAEEFADVSGSKIQVTNNPKEAMLNANVVYTDVWASMGQEAEAKKRKELFKPYQVNSELLSHASDDVIVLHCLPAHRGEEITEEVLEKYADVIFEQAENRLHAQKAIMASVM